MTDNVPPRIINLSQKSCNPSNYNRFQNKLVPILKDFFVFFFHII